MGFLSLALRELRVAARKRSTFRWRIVTSFIALFVTGFSLWFVTLFGSRPASGAQLFFTLSWMTFICACLVGPALTADSVNEERNNGTLGLLFLTNLNGISISLGKLIGHGLLALYSIVSIVPLMALPAIMGGTTAESLAKTALALFVTLLLSLLIGMFASTICRRPWLAAAEALFVLAILVLGFPLAAEILQNYQRTLWSASLVLLSPSYSLLMATPAAAMLPINHFWLAIAAQFTTALGLFGLITFLLPRIWKEGRAGKKTRYLSSTWRSLKFGSGKPRRQLRARLLNINPILWLSCRERFGPFGFPALLVLLAWAISSIGQSVRPPVPNADFHGPMIAWIVGLPLLYICFCFRLAAAASERFSADRKAGALELIVCTPIKTRDIIRGHWLGLVRRFWGAALLLLALHAFALNYIIEAIRIGGELQDFGFRDVIVNPLKHIFRVASIPNQVAPFYIACLAVMTAAILIVILWIALGWLGMALSLKLKREILAPWLSLILLAVPPIPLFLALLPFTANNDTFVSNLFLGMLSVGATGFFIVLANALLWLFLARRWTYKKLRTTVPSPLPPGILG
jgi:ABC-type transport system involved in multi-copper enzyme maturation permease subunit